MTPFLGGNRDISDIFLQTIDLIRILRVLIIIFLFFIAAKYFLATTTTQIIGMLKGPLGWYLFYGLIAMLSFVYSVQPLMSLWKGFEVTVSVMMAIYVYSRLKSYNDIKAFWQLNILIIAILVCSAYIGIIITPSKALVQMQQINFYVLAGVYPPINPNSLAQIASILCIISFVRFTLFHKSKLFYLTIILLTIPVLYLSYARTSLIALLVSIIFVLMFSKRYSFLFIGIVVISLCIFLPVKVSFIQYFEKGTSLYTFSGRLLRWPAALDLFSKSPLNGYGFYVASRVIYSSIVEVESASTTDNTYFDILLSVGIIGFVPFVMMLYSYTKKIIYVLRKKFKNFMSFNLEIISVSIIIMFKSLTGPSINILHFSLIIMLACIVCLMALSRYEDIIGT